MNFKDINSKVKSLGITPVKIILDQNHIDQVNDIANSLGVSPGILVTTFIYSLCDQYYNDPVFASGLKSIVENFKK